MNPTAQITIGLIIIAVSAIGATIGGYMVKAGFDNKKSIITTNHILSPQAEKLLSIILKYQKEFGLNKLVISREGMLHFDEKEKEKNTTLISLANFTVLILNIVYARTNLRILYLIFRLITLGLYLKQDLITPMLLQLQKKA